MTKEKLAAMLNGREYRAEITSEEEAIAKTQGFLIVFGASDDLVHLRGVTHDEIGAYDGTTFGLNKDGLLRSECENENCPHERRNAESSAIVDAIWDQEGYSWIFETKLPHVTFDIMEEGETYCRGMVIDMGEAFPT